MRILFAALFAVVLAFAPQANAQSSDPENTLILETKNGPIVIKLRPDLAPKHVERIKKLTGRGIAIKILSY